jgi:hypothetical protein
MVIAGGDHGFSIRLCIDLVRDEFGTWRWVENLEDGSCLRSREAFSNLNDCVKDLRRHITFVRLRFDAPTAAPLTHSRLDS